MSLEQEILDATGFEPRRKYEDRQDYLAAVARSVDQLEDSDFDGLSKGAVDWFNTAVRAMNKKTAIADFDGEPENAASDEPVELEIETPKKPAKKVKKAVPVEEAEIIEETVDEETGEITEIPARRKKGQPPIKKAHPPVKKAALGDVELDRYGIVKGTKNAAAVAMLEKGARMADITETLGGTYYNLVQRLVKAGHRLEKSANGMLKVTHEEDVSKKAKK